MRIVLRQAKNGSSQRYGDLYAVMCLIGILLLLRDSFGVGIHKYVFLLIIAAAAVAFPIEKVMCLISFLMPLYVGIPGNYLTLVFLIRFLLDYRKIRLNGYNFVFCVLAGGYIFVQSIVTNHMAIAELVFFPSMVLIMFMCSNDITPYRNKMVLCYTIGAAALGLIMLISTLRVYEIRDLLKATTRLGDDATSYAEQGIMNVSMDPNFYGMFAVAAISVGVQTLSEKAEQFSRVEIWILVAAVVVCITVGLIGLSRAFVLVLTGWGFMYILSTKSVKAFAGAFAAVSLILMGVLVFLPDVVDAVLLRFQEENISTGNGRTDLILKNAAAWRENLITLLFGIGIFECNVHCTPLQALFGGGILFSVLLTGFILTAGKKPQSAPPKLSFIQKWLPLVSTVLMSMTVPGLALLNYMYPIVFVGLCTRK